MTDKATRVSRNGITIMTSHGRTTVLISAAATERWARGWYGNARWPCSRLAGKRLRAEFETNGDLADLRINGSYWYDAPGDELDAMLETLIGTARPTATRA